MQQLETFPHQLNGQTRYTCHVAARPVQARYEAELDRSTPATKTIGMVEVGALAANVGTMPAATIMLNLTTNQLSREDWQSIVITFGPPIFDRHFPAFDIAGFVQALPEGCENAEGVVELPGFAAEEADHRLLRAYH